jgi:hypothetical protein
MFEGVLVDPITISQGYIVVLRVITPCSLDRQVSFWRTALLLSSEQK